MMFRKDETTNAVVIGGAGVINNLYYHYQQQHQHQHQQHYHKHHSYQRYYPIHNVSRQHLYDNIMAAITTIIIKGHQLL